MASPNEAAAASSRTSLRRFRAAHGGAGAKVKPEFAVHDDDGSDDEAEGSLMIQRVSWKGKLRRRNVARQVSYEWSEVGIQTVPGSVTATAEGPGVTDDVSGSDDDDDEEESGWTGGPMPTSWVESITASLGDGMDPTSVPGAEPSEDIDSDSDSDDESTTLDPTQRPTGTFEGIGASQTASDPLPASSTAISPDPDASAEAAKNVPQKHHQEVETALIVVGCIAGLICIGVGVWFFIRRRARKIRDLDSDSQSRLRRFRLPFVSSRERAWEELSDEKNLYGTEKDMGMRGSDLLAYLPDKPAPVAAVTQSPMARRGDEKGYSAPVAGGGDTFGANNNNSNGNFNKTVFLRQSISSPDQLPYSPTETSLSSAFGNGTYIPPTPLHPPPRAQIPHEPPPIPTSNEEAGAEVSAAAQRDTIYTQTSEASSVPRFRTVNSWVRQQTRRKADEVPEQGYGLMAPDGEVPRRVQWNVVRPEGVGFAK